MKKLLLSLFAISVLLAGIGLLIFLSGRKNSEDQKLPGETESTYTPEVEKAIRLFYRGTSALEVNEYARAAEDLGQLIRMTPEEPAAWANLGLLEIRRSTDSLGLEYLKKALSLTPNGDRINYLLGNYYFLKGQPNQAAIHWQKAVEKNSQNRKAVYALLKQSVPSANSHPPKIRNLFSLLYSARNPALPLVLLEMEWFIGEKSGGAYPDNRLDSLLDNAPWPKESLESVRSFRKALRSKKFPKARITLAGLRNILIQNPGFQMDLEQLEDPPELIGTAFKHPLRLPTPRRAAPPADTHLSFERPNRPGNLKTLWLKKVYLSHHDGYRALFFDGRQLVIPALNASLEIEHSPFHPFHVAALDLNYDFKMDLAVLDGEKLRFWIQSEISFRELNDLFQGKLPGTSGGYLGLWTYDHDGDGDLDLLVSPPGHSPLLLLRGNTFSLIGDSPFPRSSGVQDFVTVDLNGDGRSDAGLLDEEGKLHVYLNIRSGEFNLEPAFGNLTKGLTLQTADLNENGMMEILVLDSTGSVFSVEYSHGERIWTFQEIITTDLQWSRESGNPKLFIEDLDNNGMQDVIVSRTSRTHAWLAESQGAYHKLNALEYGVHAVLDLNGDGKLDLWGIQEGTEFSFIQDSTNDYRWQFLKIQTRSARGDRRINSFGIGGEAEIRSGFFYQKQSVSQPLLHFGLGREPSIDIARILWPNGTAQNEFDLLPNQTVFAEQRLKGSCPWVFGFDGDSVNFIADFLWRSPLGLKINAQTTAPIAQTEDRIAIRGNQLKPEQGRYDLRVTAELWETHFIDHLSLMEIDHPEGTEIYVDERYGRTPPSLETILTGLSAPILKAYNLSGKDVTDLLYSRDNQFLGQFSLGPYQGLAEDHGVVLHVDLRSSGKNIPLLIARGWIYPTDSSINIALGQGHPIRPRGIRVEYWDPEGRWKILYEDLGFPAGKCKTILINLEKIPREGMQKLRLSTNLEIYWDSFHIAGKLGSKDMKQLRLPTESARLDYRGFSQYRERREESPELPEYKHLRGRAQEWRDLEGFYTRFGDVADLLKGVDDQYVIMNAGDEIQLRFRASDSLPKGWIRDFVLVGDGWTKDGDYNTVDSKTVTPLPGHGSISQGSMKGQMDWEDMNTRYVTQRRFREALLPN